MTDGGRWLAAWERRGAGGGRYGGYFFGGTGRADWARYSSLETGLSYSLVNKEVNVNCTGHL